MSRKRKRMIIRMMNSFKCIYHRSNRNSSRKVKKDFNINKIDSNNNNNSNKYLNSNKN
jgi:hypothetical protein